MKAVNYRTDYLLVDVNSNNANANFAIVKLDKKNVENYKNISEALMDLEAGNGIVLDTVINRIGFEDVLFFEDINKDFEFEMNDYLEGLNEYTFVELTEKELSKFIPIEPKIQVNEIKFYTSGGFSFVANACNGEYEFETSYINDFVLFGEKDF